MYSTNGQQNKGRVYSNDSKDRFQLLQEISFTGEGALSPRSTHCAIPYHCEFDFECCVNRNSVWIDERDDLRCYNGLPPL